MLIQRRAIKLPKAMLIAWKMRRHPVHDHADARLVAGIHQVAEIIRLTEPVGRRVHANGLIPPGTIEGMLRGWKQFDVGESHIADVADQFVREFAVTQGPVALFRLTPPRAKVHFIDADGAVHTGIGPALPHPVFILPSVSTAVNNGCIARGRLEIMRHGIRLQRQQTAIGAQKFKFVLVATGNPGNKNLPNAATRMQPHHVTPAIPAIEIADHADPKRVGRPDCETGTLHAELGLGLRAQRAVNLLVRTLSQQVEVEVTQGGRKAIGVFDVVSAASGFLNTQPVMTVPA